MIPDKAIIRSYFAKLDLEPEIADLYLALCAHGPQTISELSRSSTVERTRIYRLIDQLIDSHLIEVESHYKRGVLKAAPIANLHILISRREQELQGLQDELQLIEQVLSQQASLSSPATRVQFYQGSEGVKQMFWNETRAKAGSDICGILHENMPLKTDSRFFERWAGACNQKDLYFRGIVDANFQASQAAWYGEQVVQQRLTHWQARSIATEDFPITHGTITYGAVVAYYNWQDSEIFGIEIYNQDIANSQRRLFELLWDRSTAAA